MKGTFTKMVEGWSHEVDAQEIRRALTLLMREGELHEIRALPGGGGGVAGLDGCVAMATKYADHHQVYYSLNPVTPGSERANKRTVARRSNLLIDSDPVKADPDASATDAEKAAAMEVLSNAVAWLAELGWPEPLVIDSGNGFHAVYRCDLPNDDLTQQLVKAWLAALATKFDTPGARIDRATHDAPRIAKLPGTWARKGTPTDDRPHRQCKIQFPPASVEATPLVPVSLELLREAAGMGEATPESEPARPSTELPAGFTKRVDSNDGARHLACIRRAVESECLKVAIASDHRNDKLNDAAFRLGTMAGWPEMDDVETRRLLTLSAERAGLTKEEIPKTIASGWEAGKREPRKRLDEVDREKGKAKAPAIITPERPKFKGPITRGLAEIQPMEIEWLWEGMVAIGFISMFAGRTGVGKSMALCDLAARASRGEPPPFSNLKLPPYRTLIISEDPQEQMLAPRFLEAGTVLKCPLGRDYVRFMTFDAMAEFTLDNEDALNQAYEECHEPRHVIIDPPTNFLGGVDEHKNADMRKVLKGVVKWINEKKVAMSFISHLNKAAGKGLDAVERIAGTVAWSTTARITVAFDKDPDNPTRFLCGATKTNLGAVGQPLSYEILRGEVTGRINWLGRVDTSMDDAVNRIKKKSRAENAAEWLAAQFRQQGAWPSDDLYALGREAGVSRSAIWEAAQALPLKREQIAPQDGGKRYWQWTARPGWPPEPKEECGGEKP